MNFRMCIRHEKLLMLILAVPMLLGNLSEAYAQGKGQITGKILDSLSSAPVSFATIRVFSTNDKKLINGDISHDAGDFSIELPFGKYYAEIDFMGYESRKTGDFVLSQGKPIYDFGNIKLVTSVSTLDEVVVQAEKSSMELSLDKKSVQRRPGPGQRWWHSE